MIERVGRSRARYLAPAALLAVMVATALVVAGGLRQTPAQRAVGRALRGHAGRGLARPRHVVSFYVVRSGDTLSAIAQRTGVPVATLESLNHGIDPTSLQAGERLRLR